jgi:hypothetical protein
MASQTIPATRRDIQAASAGRTVALPVIGSRGFGLARWAWHAGVSASASALEEAEDGVEGEAPTRALVG